LVFKSLPGMYQCNNVLIHYYKREIRASHEVA
jgi:hypothetical protein